MFVSIMEPKHKEILRAHRLYLCEQLVVEDTIIQYLYQEDILTESLVEEIQSQSCNRKKTLELLNTLPHRGPNAFSAFIQALQPDFPWITEKLLLSVQDQSNSAENTRSVSTAYSAVPEHLLQMVPSDLQLNRLASRLGSEWETVMLDLGLTQSEIYRCRADHPFNSQCQVLAALVIWKQSQGRRATVQRLLHSLETSEIHPSSIEQVFI
ncbi:death domain-containing protein CRADD [Trichomycterus rosablanca]|uniref:death domain-containing protein CRADD n=1 Tax=Trichomycterus rosablanca TaxID=2290929 RepID=UPI002F34F022